MKLTYVLSVEDITRAVAEGEISSEVVVLRLLKSLGAPILGNAKMRVDPDYDCKSFRGPLFGDLHFEFTERAKK